MNALFGIKPDNHVTTYIPFTHILYCYLLSDAEVEDIGGRKVCICEKSYKELLELPRYSHKSEQVAQSLKELEDCNLIGVVGNRVYLGTYVDKIFSPYLPVEDTFKEAKRVLKKEIAAVERELMCIGGGSVWLDSVRDVADFSKEDVEKYGIAGKIYGAFCNLYCRGNTHSNLTQIEASKLRTTLIRRHGNVETFCLMVQVLFVNNINDKKLPEIYALINEVALLAEKLRVKRVVINDDEDELRF